MEKNEYPGNVLCINCGYMLALHVTANFTDGAFVGQYLTICPTALFLAQTKPEPPAMPRLR